MIALKLEAMGDSLGVVLPEEMISGLQIKEGGVVFALETPEGYLLLRNNSLLADKLRRTGRIVDRHENALKELTD